MKNEEYYITYQLGYWKKVDHWTRCSGDIVGTECHREIPPGEKFLKTNITDFDGISLYLCQECAKKEA